MTTTGGALRTVLDGIKVLDFTRDMVGPYATMVLGDFGADVIKVESAPRGDPHRTGGTHFLGGESVMFLNWNREKRSLCLDLRAPETRALLHRLIADVDVLVENFRPQVPERMGIDWPTASAVNPRLVHVSITGFGSDGPWSHRPGTDVTLQAMSGVMSVNAEPDRLPLLIGVPFASFTTAQVAVQSVLFGLLQRQATGVGQRFEVPMLGVMIASLGTRLGPYFATGENPVPTGSRHHQVAPMQVFRTADGLGFVGVSHDKFERFCNAIGRPELLEDPRFATNPDRVEHAEELAAVLAPVFLERTTQQWVRLFEDAAVAFSPVNTFSEILESDHVRESGFLTTVEHPKAGTIRQVAPLVRIPGEQAAIRRPPPLLGEHNEEVLREFGFSATEIGALADRHVLHTGTAPDRRER
ncbi:MAG TPA: CoA transferase [Actinophytocola sp.]|jgi:formyl-CoA transferase/CoA:oxalate CoA-transferase|nr:CoA transferase [Actinophytocola sp.]